MLRFKLLTVFILRINAQKLQHKKKKKGQENESRYRDAWRWQRHALRSIRGTHRSPLNRLGFRLVRSAYLAPCPSTIGYRFYWSLDKSLTLQLIPESWQLHTRQPSSKSRFLLAKNTFPDKQALTGSFSRLTETKRPIGIRCIGSFPSLPNHPESYYQRVA